MRLVCLENFPQKHIVFLQSKISHPFAELFLHPETTFYRKRYNSSLGVQCTEHHLVFVSAEIHRLVLFLPPHPFFKFNTPAMIVHYQIMQTLRQFLLLFWKAGTVLYLTKKCWYFL